MRQHFWSRWLALTFALAVVGVTTTACQTAETVSRRGELDVALSRHHVDLRWGRVQIAARYVHADLQKGFVEDWERQGKDIEITDLEVINVFESADGKSADVQIHVAWVEKRSQSFHEALITERWEEVDGRWIATRPAAIVLGQKSSATE